METLDIIDANNNIVGTASKEECHTKGLPHRVSAVLVRNSENRYLIPTASNIKVEKGKLYHSAAGHVASRDTYESTAIRELREETSLIFEEDDLTLLGSFWFIKKYPERTEKERFQVYVVDQEDFTRIRFNDEQINEQWLSLEELKEILFETPVKLSTPLLLTISKFLI